MDKFQSLSKKSLFAFGGPNNFKSKPIQASRIIKQIILDGNYIHSCIDYDGHLQFVKEAALEINKPLKMILKCYLNYPEISSIRRKTIYSQIKRFEEIFGNLEIEIIPQISSISLFTNKDLFDFIKLIYYEFGINILLFESFPFSEKIIKKFVISIKEKISFLGLNSKFIIGVTAYENISTIGLSKTMTNFISENKLIYVPMRVLAKANNVRDISSSKKKLKNDIKYQGFFCAITKVSNMDQYNDLKNFSNKNRYKLNSTKNLKLYRDKFVNADFAINPYGFKKRNFIGIIKLNFINSFKKIKFIIHCILRNKPLNSIRLIFNQNFL